VPLYIDRSLYSIGSEFLGGFLQKIERREAEKRKVDWRRV
jgi:hypothetical protein